MNNQIIDFQIIFGKFFYLYLLIKWIFIVLNLILIFGLIFSFYKAWKFRPKFIFKQKSRGKIINLKKENYRIKWFDVINKFEINSPIARKMALVDADNLIDLILKDLNIKGKTMADRLSKIHPESLESLKDLWEAHHIRNDIINNPDFDLNEEESKKILGYYKKFLKEIGVIIE